MKTFPLPALAAALAALAALPFSLAAAGTLLMTAALGAIIRADYCRACHRVRLPKLAATPALAPAVVTATPATDRTECRPLAA